MAGDGGASSGPAPNGQKRACRPRHGEGGAAHGDERDLPVGIVACARVRKTAPAAADEERRGVRQGRRAGQRSPIHRSDHAANRAAGHPVRMPRGARYVHARREVRRGADGSHDGDVRGGSHPFGRAAHRLQDDRRLGVLRSVARGSSAGLREKLLLRRVPQVLRRQDDGSGRGAHGDEGDGQQARR